MVAARSYADAPVVVRSLASMLTLNAVPSRLVLRSTIGAIPSSSRRRANTGIQTSPDPWRVMKLMCSGVTSSAATTRSPSFSRSSSSTTITNLPAAKSEIASGTVASPIRYLILLAQVAGHVSRHHVRLDVDHAPGAIASGNRDLERVRDERHLEGAGRFVHRGYGKA